MAIKTFSSGEVLTASDTNTYLANSGLVFIKQQSISAGASTIPVTNCFSSTYDNYRIVWSDIDCTAGYSAYMTLNGSTGSTYNAAGTFIPISGSAGSGQQAAQVSAWLGIMGTDWSGVMDIYRPFQSTTTNYTMNSTSSNYQNWIGGYDSNTASSTGFTFVPSIYSFSGGTITVFGYRKQ